MAKKKVRKAVFPAAGLGTRFLPATKAQPKEMMPLVDKPIIQYGVEEALAAGCDQIIIVTGRGKSAIEDHFDVSYELEKMLEERGKTDLLAVVRQISDMIHVAYVRQKEAMGLGHAVLMARELVGDEPFAVILADDIIDAEVPCLKQMIDVYNETGCSVLATQVVEGQGHLGVRRARRASRCRASGMAACSRCTTWWRSRSSEDAPSNLAIIGRYILTPAIFEMLASTELGAGGELQLTDGLKHLLKKEKIYGYTFRRQASRYRRQAGIPEGDGRVCAEARGSGRRVSGVPEDAEAVKAVLRTRSLAQGPVACVMAISRTLFRDLSLGAGYDRLIIGHRPRRHRSVTTLQCAAEIQEHPRSRKCRMLSRLKERSMAIHSKEDILSNLDDEVFGTSFLPGPLPKYRMPKHETDPAAAYQLVHDELLLDGNSRQNVATFCQTWVEPEIRKLMDECLNKNMIDNDEYPQMAELESRSVHMLADLWNSPDAANTIGCSTTGSSEAAMLGGLALKTKWRVSRQVNLACISLTPIHRQVRYHEAAAALFRAACHGPLMKEFYICDCARVENQTITSLFVVASKQVKSKKNGDLYLSITLADRSGQLQANMWDNVADAISTPSSRTTSSRSRASFTSTTAAGSSPCTRCAGWASRRSTTPTTFPRPRKTSSSSGARWASLWTASRTRG